MILCGGSGDRLWPASRPERPKPFLSLVGPHSLLQSTVLRVRPLVDGGDMLVVGGAAHAGLIFEQLAAIAADALPLLEPIGQGTAAAIAAAAAWVAQRRPDAVLVVTPADHHAPDGNAFRAAVAATLPAARDGAIVTLGLQPTWPSTAMGYIRPGVGGDRVRPILSFVEKPDVARAEALMADGALWNSGVFVATAQMLLEEIQRHAAEVASAATAALHGVLADAGAVRLGAAFAQAPRIAFDRAVMERTARGAVLPTAFPWSDLGAWDAVLAASDRDAAGNSLSAGATAPGSTDVLVRAAPGSSVLVTDARRLAVVSTPDAALVCNLGRAQDVRPGLSGAANVRAAPGMTVRLLGAEAAVVAAPEGLLVRGLGGGRWNRPGRFTTLSEAAGWFAEWLSHAALPLWATAGVDPATGAFREALTWEGAPHDPRRRARVAARQSFVFSRAAMDRRPGPWAMVGADGFDWFAAHARRSDGLYAACLDVSGRPTDPEARLYEHAFVLLALAALRRAEEAHVIAGRLAETFRHPAGGFREAGDQPFQANAQMHLFEAALAWEAAEPGGPWAAMADAIAALALERFIEPETGALHEFFDTRWAPLAGDAAVIEPGHQFEWAWLLERWGTSRGDADARAAARRLFEVGRAGFDDTRDVVCNALRPDFTVRDAGARLWPQTEHVKAALILGETEAALQAANGLVGYLDTPQAGAWRERMTADGTFVEEPSPATSLYHLYLAIGELTRVAAKP